MLDFSPDLYYNVVKKSNAKEAREERGMTEKLHAFFEERSIEYYAVLDYTDCRETSHEIMSRESFTPRSVIIYLLPYYTGETVNISRYAASLDYHLIIGEVGAALAERIGELYPTSKSCSYGDHSPIDERHAALIAGLGMLGDSGLLINEKYGTYSFIGDLITDIPPEKLGVVAPKKIEKCSGCGACKRACPTGILRGESVDCLSAITQRKGALTDMECALMREYNTAWGCDICQTACPHNASPKKTPIPFFYTDPIYNLTREALDRMDKATFRQRAFAWRGRMIVERNLDILDGD